MGSPQNSKRFRATKKVARTKKTHVVNSGPCFATGKGKVKYRKHSAAEEQMSFTRAMYPNRHNLPVRVYRCEDCGYYHLTSMPIEAYDDGK